MVTFLFLCMFVQGNTDILFPDYDEYVRAVEKQNFDEQLIETQRLYHQFDSMPLFPPTG